MTFTAIVAAVAERHNLTSTEALQRIARNTNSRYRRVTSSIGLQPSRRATDTQATVAANPRATFDLEKLEVVYCLASGARRVLQERTYDEWRNTQVDYAGTGAPDWYAIEESGAETVTIVLYPTPDDAISLVADGLEPADDMASDDVPAFAASFHDVLVFGASADEYRKLDRAAQAHEMEVQFEMRLSELRYFLAKSSYLTRHQGPRRGVSPNGRRDWRV